MISGMVNTEREATVRLTLIGRSGGQVRVEAVIDTGYDGWLVLSPALITELGYAWTNECNAILADGSKARFNVYRGTILWDRRRRTIKIDEAESSPLIGMGLLEDHELNIQARNSGSVRIRRLLDNP